jgi:hypothetical protein
MAVLHSWPLASDPLHLGRLDNDDAALNMWVIAWVAHILPRDPLQLFEAPIFHPEPHALAYSEHLLVPALLGAPLLWLGASPVLVHNLLIIAGLALSGWAMYLLMVRWTASTGAGVVAGLVYAFNAHTLTRFVHLQAFHVWLFPAMLYAFDRVLSGGSSNPGWRHVVLLVAAFAGQALSSNYLMVFAAASLAVVALVRIRDWAAPSRASVRKHLVVAAIASVILLMPFLYPYYEVGRSGRLTHTFAEISHYSATWREYLATGGRVHYEAWSRSFMTDTALFPGVLALILAAVAIGAGEVGRDPRARMAAAIALAGFVFSFGTRVPGYWWLHEHVPLLGALRAVERWGWLALAGLAILAGFGAAVIRRRVAMQPRQVWPAVVVVLCIVVTIEALRAPVGLTEFAGIPRLYERLAGDEPVVLAEFPFFAGQAWSQNGRYVLHNTRYFKPLINGYSSYSPPPWQARAQLLESFPSPAAVDALRALNTTHIAVHVQAFAQRHGEAALAAIGPVPGLQLLTEEDGIRLYRLTPSTRDRATIGQPITRSGSSK